MGEREYWLGFSAMPGVGPVRFALLLKHFGNAEKAWEAAGSDLVKAGLGEKLTAKFTQFRREFSVGGYAKKLREKEVSFWTLEDEGYPKLLKEIPNAPFVLYVRGSKEILNQVQNDKNKHIAVVGTRKVTNYGRDVTRMLVSELVANGFTIVSGLAIGIDSVAHEAAIEAASNAVSTIAVLGSGVDVCYPRNNLSLYEKIIDGNGFVVSEFPIGQTPTVGSFPSRNRIIAGLSLGVLVTEGAQDSGALITADYAFKNNRPVFAVPGPITSSLSKGPHKLLSKGAKIVTSGEDIVSEFGIMKNEPGRGIKGKKGIKSIKGASKEEERILGILENEELHIDEIVRRSGKTASEVGSLLSIMQVKGMVREVGGGVFSLSV